MEEHKVKTVKRSIRYLGLSVAIWTLILGFMLVVYAANTLTWANSEELEARYEAANGVSWGALSPNSNVITGSVSGVDAAGCASASSRNTTLTLTSKMQSEATLVFTVNQFTNNGSIKIGDKSVEAAETFSMPIASGGQIDIELQSGNGSSNATSLEVQVTILRDAVTTIYPGVNGSVTVDGTKITQAFTDTRSSETGYVLTATANPGYRFLGWYSGESGHSAETFLSAESSTTIRPSKDTTIHAEFVSTSFPLFKVGGMPFVDLSEANTYATNGSEKTILLVESGTVSGSHTISSGVKLLVPYSASDTGSETQNDTAASQGKVYRTLTFAEGSTLSVDGTVIVNAEQGHYNTKNMGSIRGAYGSMVVNGAITVNDGGVLKARGIISGNGSITAKSGADVYQFAQFTDFRGGSATFDIYKSVFPLNQFYLQNIQVDTVYEAGSELYGYYYVYANRMGQGGTVKLLGSSDAFLFYLKTGSVLFEYDQAAAKTTVSLSGEMETHSISMTIAVIYTMDTSAYECPISGAFDINVASGSKLAIAESLKILPGCTITVDEGAEVTVGTDIYLYDVDDYQADYVVNTSGFTYGNYRSLPQTALKGANVTYKESKDGSIVVNGTVTVNGKIYSSAGAGVGSSSVKTTSASGIIKMNTVAEESTSIKEGIQKSDGGKTTSVSFAPVKAKLVTTENWQPLTAGVWYSTGDMWYQHAVTVKNEVSGNTETEYIVGHSYTVSIPEGTCDVTISDTNSVYENGEITGLTEKEITVTLVGHTEVIDAAVAATCTETGLTEGKHCSVCNEVIVAQEVVDALGHTEVVDAAVAPTCTETGLTEGKHCSACGEVFVAQEVVDALGHTEVVDAAKAPTCTETGLTEGSHCGVCGEIIVAQEVVPALGHSLDANGQCEICNQKFQAVVTLPKNDPKYYKDVKMAMDDTADKADATITIYFNYTVTDVFDLFGRTINGPATVGVDGGMVIDSKTDDYNAADAGSIANYAGPAVCSPDKGTALYGKHYAAIENTDGTYSFHRVAASVTAYQVYLVQQEAYLSLRGDFRSTPAGLLALTDLGFVVGGNASMYVGQTDESTGTTYTIEMLRGENGYSEPIYYNFPTSTLTVDTAVKMVFGNDHAVSANHQIDLAEDLKAALDELGSTHNYYTPILNYLKANNVDVSKFEGGAEG